MNGSYTKPDRALLLELKQNIDSCKNEGQQKDWTKRHGVLLSRDDAARLFRIASFAVDLELEPKPRDRELTRLFAELSKGVKVRG